MKRQFNLLSSETDDSEPVSKRVRLLALLPLKSDEEEIIINEPIISIDSQSKDDDIIEIEYENNNRICQEINNVIILISDSESDDDQDIDVTNYILPVVSPIIMSSPSNENIEILEEETENEHKFLEIVSNELIDLTDDEPNSTSYSSIDLQQCPICLETLSYLQYTGVYLVITQCCHVMCTLCSRQLLVTSSRCPLCRENVSSTTLIPYCILP